jgi:hypothetical protein
MYVIKHTDRNEFVRCRKVMSFWTDELDEATKFDTEIDAEIEIRRRGIPYCRPVSVDAILNYDEKGNWVGTVANENGWTA